MAGWDQNLFGNMPPPYKPPTAKPPRPKAQPQPQPQPQPQGDPGWSWGRVGADLYQGATHPFTALGNAIFGGLAAAPEAAGNATSYAAGKLGVPNPELLGRDVQSYLEMPSLSPSGAAHAVEGTTLAAAPLALTAKAAISEAETAAGALKEAAPEAKGILAYHASPHVFDQFDASKIGTGEGAQMYGRGFYAAESPAVSGPMGSYDLQFTAKNLGKYDLNQSEAMALQGIRQGKSDMDILTDLGRNGATFDEANSILENVRKAKANLYDLRINADPNRMLDWDKPVDPDTQPMAFEALRKAGMLSGDDLASQMRRELTQRMNDRQLDEGPALQQWHDELGKAWKAGDDNAVDKQRVIEDWWDRTNDQGVSAALAPTGRDIWQQLGVSAFDKFPDTAAGRAEALQGVSSSLNQAGVPGIKYLDQGSRGAGTGTSNYVVFDPATIEILKRYGLIGLGGAVGAGALMNQPDGAPRGPLAGPPPQRRLNPGELGT